MRLKGRVDANQGKLVEIARKMGVSVHITSGLGKGFPDCIMGFRGRNYMVEFKDGSKVPSKQKLTRDELFFHQTWSGKIHVITNEQELMEMLNVV